MVVSFFRDRPSCQWQCQRLQWLPTIQFFFSRPFVKRGIVGDRQKKLAPPPLARMAPNNGVNCPEACFCRFILAKRKQLPLNTHRKPSKDSKLTSYFCVIIRSALERPLLLSPTFVKPFAPLRRGPAPLPHYPTPAPSLARLQHSLA